ncbi:MAG: pyridoxal-phosphate-dependent aminotransferase family protein [Thermoprotei archaeon]|jgi:aspartate aminotransferase-like enzyme
MDERFLLMIPGPTFSNASTLLSLAKPTISHVSKEFGELMNDTLNNLKKLLNTDGEVVVIAGGGTAAMEFSIANFVKPGDKVLNLISGYFGEYFVKAIIYRGGTSIQIKSKIGQGFSGNDIRDIVEREKIKFVTVQHVETSTGVANHIKTIGESLRGTDTLFIVDAVASLGGMNIDMRNWNIDVCFSASQKALAVPPGLAIIGLSKKAVEIIEKSSDELFYFNGRKWLATMRDVRNYYSTLPVNMIYGLNESLKRIMDEGLEQRYKRHQIMAEALRQGIESLGLKIVAEKEYRSDTVTAIWLPDNVKFSDLSKEMINRNIIIAGGLGELSGKIFRIGHMGSVNANDIISTLSALERSLKKLGYHIDFGASIKAAQEVYDNFNY